MVIREEEIPGVDGTMIRLEKDRSNAYELDRIDLYVGEILEIDWKYPVIPGSFPVSAKAILTRSIIKLLDIRIVRHHQAVGGETLAARFLAHESGDALITFAITTQNDDDSLRTIELNAEVTIRKL